MRDGNPETFTFEDLEPDGLDEQTATWFEGKLLNCINALHEADRDERLRIKGRMHVLMDLFGLSDAEAVALAKQYEAHEQMAEILDYDGK